MNTIFSGKHFCDDAKNAAFIPNPPLLILIFFLVMLITSIAQMIPAIFLRIIAAIALPPEAYELWSTPISLFSTIVPAILVIVYCRFIEKRPVSTMGLSKKNIIPDYLKGLLISFAAFSAVVLIGVMTGTITYNGTDFTGGIPFIIVICLCWMIQGAEEEILCRGWLMTSLGAKMPLWLAAILNSVVFSALHLFNNGISPIAIINLILVGILFSALTIRFDSLIPACAAHTIWNLVQGNFYGLPVSGMDTGYSVFDFDITETGALLSGGEFGPESGLIATGVIAVMTVAVIFIPKKERAENEA